MGNWKRIEKVEIEDVFQKIPVHWNQYKIVLSKKREGVGRDLFEVSVQGSQFAERVNRLLQKETTREYLSFGMQDIDIYATPDGSFAIDHSPFGGEHDVYLLKKGELEKLYHALTFTPVETGKKKSEAKVTEQEAFALVHVYTPLLEGETPESAEDRIQTLINDKLDDIGVVYVQEVREP